MRNKNSADPAGNRPIRFLQFGDNAFSRAFFGRLLQKANESGQACANSVIIRDEKAVKGQKQYNVYTVHAADKIDREDIRVDSVTRVLDPFTEYEQLLSLSDDKEISVILWAPAAPAAFSGEKMKKIPQNAVTQLTMLLFRRFCLERHGFIILPTADTDRNGEELKNCVIRYSEHWKLGIDFINWLNLENTFCDTVAESFTDSASAGTGALEIFTEKYLRFVVSAKKDIRAQLPFGSEILWAEDILPYRTMKKRVYDGALTVSAAYAVLHDVETAADFTSRPRLVKHMTVSVFEEIVPTVDMSFEEIEIYALDTIRRLSTPYIKILWKDLLPGIAGKFAENVLPAFEEYQRQNQQLPKHLVFSLFCILQVYRIYDIRDSFSTVLSQETTPQILTHQELWEQDLSYLAEEIQRYEARLQGAT